VHRIKKKQKTEKCQCPFAVKAKERPTGLWELCHFENPIKATHNHPPFDYASGTWQHRKLTLIQLETIKTNHAATIAARQTITSFRGADPTILAKKRDIYNAVAQELRAGRKGMALPEAFICRLERGKADGILEFYVKYHLDGAIKNLWVSETVFLEYFNDNLNCALRDATYKTNKFGMPCFYVIGINGKNQQFFVFMCFINNETSDNYDFPIKNLVRHLRPSVWPLIFACDTDNQLI
jgi:hypothetical protein